MSATSAAVKRHGRHYTPAGLARFLAERLLRQLAGETRIRVLDPACGDGELLLAIHETARRLIPDAVLTLVGFDLDPDAVTLAAQRSAALGVEVDLRSGDFLQLSQALPAGSFDAVITNPPYVRTQQLGQETAQLLAAEFGLGGRIDLTHPFVSVSSALLRAGGVIGLLCSNRFLTTKAGANVRRILQTSLRPRELYDLGDTKLFTATVLPAIVVAVNTGSTELLQPDCSFASAYEVAGEDSGAAVSLYEALVADDGGTVAHRGRAIQVKIGTLVPGKSSVEPWRISSDEGDAWLKRIKDASWATFGEVGKIRVGIKTTADGVFISDDWESKEPPPEPEILLPLITHADVAAWRISDQLPARVLYPYDLSNHKRTLVDMSRYPAAVKYLGTHEERLRARKYVVPGGREWFEIWVPQRPALWAAPKIIFPDISETARFAYDRSGAVVNGDCYWISSHDLAHEDLAYLMVAIANSALGLRYYDEVCGNKLYSGRRRWITQYVSRFPLPDPRLDVSQELIAAVKDALAGVRRPTAQDLARIDRLVEQAFR